MLLNASDTSSEYCRCYTVEKPQVLREKKEAQLYLGSKLPSSDALSLCLLLIVFRALFCPRSYAPKRNCMCCIARVKNIGAVAERGRHNSRILLDPNFHTLLMHFGLASDPQLHFAYMVIFQP